MYQNKRFLSTCPKKILPGRETVCCDPAYMSLREIIKKLKKRLDNLNIVDYNICMIQVKLILRETYEAVPIKVVTQIKKNKPGEV